MKTMIVTTLILLVSQSAFADLRSFHCRFTDGKKRQVAATIEMESARIGHGKFIANLELKVDDIHWPAVPATVWEITQNIDGKITSVKARFGDDSKRAYLGAESSSHSTALVDLSKRPDDTQALPAVCDEL